MARDGDTGAPFIVHARPKPALTRAVAGAILSHTVRNAGKPLVKGLDVGSAVTNGRVSIIGFTHKIDQFVDGTILATSTTDPDWVLIMKRASAIVTDHEGRTSHAAIAGTGNATHVLHDKQEVTVSGTGGDEGIVHEGIAEFTTETLHPGDRPATQTKGMIDLATPSAAFRWW